MWRTMHQIAHEPLTTRLFSWGLACSLAFWVGAYGAYGIATTAANWKTVDAPTMHSGNAYANSTTKLSRTRGASDTSQIVHSIRKIESVTLK